MVDVVRLTGVVEAIKPKFTVVVPFPLTFASTFQRFVEVTELNDTRTKFPATAFGTETVVEAPAMPVKVPGAKLFVPQFVEPESVTAPVAVKATKLPPRLESMAVVPFTSIPASKLSETL